MIRYDCFLGLAEVIKYGLIYDANFFEWLDFNINDILLRNNTLISEMLRNSCQIKANIVNLDEKESGIRATLNLGHTFG